MKTISDRVLLFALLLNMCIWGISWSSAKVLSTYSDAFHIAFIRFLFTFIALFLILKKAGVSLKIERKGLPSLIIAGVLMTIYGLLFFYGLQKGFAGAAGVLVTTVNPIFAFLIGAVISKHIPNKRERIGLVIGVIAGAILMKVWLHIDALFASGNIYFVLAAFTWAVMSKISSKANQYGNSLSFSLWMHLVMVLSLLPFISFYEVKRILVTGDGIFWGNMMYFSVINSALATTCFLYAAARLGPEKASGFIFLVPCTAAIASWILLGEQLTLTTAVGGGLGIIAVMIMNGKFKLFNK